MKFENSKKQGDSGLGSAIAYFTSLGLTVSIPLTDSQDYDLIVDLNGLKKVQVKTTASKSDSGNFVTRLVVSGGNRSGTGIIKKFDNKLVDLVFILTSEGDRYLIPAIEISSTTKLNLGKEVLKFKL